MGPLLPAFILLLFFVEIQQVGLQHHSHRDHKWQHCQTYLDFSSTITLLNLFSTKEGVKKNPKKWKFNGGGPPGWERSGPISICFKCKLFFSRKSATKYYLLFYRNIHHQTHFEPLLSLPNLRFITSARNGRIIQKERK